MIVVHRLRGEQLYLNPDLIESIESTPDTTLRLIDGRTLVVSDSVSEVIQRIAEFRARILAAVDRAQSAPRPTLKLLPGEELPT